MGVWQTSAWYIRRASSLKQAGVIPGIDRLVGADGNRIDQQPPELAASESEGEGARISQEPEPRASEAACSRAGWTALRSSRPSAVRPPSDFAFGFSSRLGVLTFP